MSIDLESITRQEVRSILQDAGLGELARLEVLKAKLALTEAEVSDLVGVSRSSLQKDRVQKIGIRYFKRGGSVYYRTKDVVDFMVRQTIRTRDQDE